MTDFNPTLQPSNVSTKPAINFYSLPPLRFPQNYSLPYLRYGKFGKRNAGNAKALNIFDKLLSFNKMIQKPGGFV